MDIEKIRLETVELYKAKIIRQNETDPYAKLVDSMIDISSRISKTMLEKYHEELKTK